LQLILDSKVNGRTVTINEIQRLKRNQEGINEAGFGMHSSVLLSEINLPQERHFPEKLVIIEDYGNSKCKSSKTISLEKNN